MILLPRVRKLVVRRARADAGAPQNKRGRNEGKKKRDKKRRMVGVKNYRTDRNTERVCKKRGVAAGEAKAREHLPRRARFIVLLKDSKRSRHARKY